MGGDGLTRNLTLVGTPAETSRFATVTVPMDELNVTAGQTVLARVTAGTLDARPVDNVARTTVTVIAPDPDDDGRPARDLDDGEYEDIDGDGQFSILDIAVFLNTFDETAADPRFFDFIDDGGVSIADVAALLRQI